MSPHGLPDITDVANWFLDRESMRHKKLQKLCYYAVAWSYALFDRQMCERDKFEAWVHGPVNRILYDKYKNYVWGDIPSVNCPANFGESEETLRLVWNTYGGCTGDDLEFLTHDEYPWLNARTGLLDFELSSKEIDVEDMKSYYRRLLEQTQND